MRVSKAMLQRCGSQVGEMRVPERSRQRVGVEIGGFEEYVADMNMGIIILQGRKRIRNTISYDECLQPLSIQSFHHSPDIIAECQP